MPSLMRLHHIADDIVGCAITVHTRVGTGCFENAYSPCFGRELRKRGLAYRTQVAIPLKYDDIIIQRAYVADFIVEGCVVVELKAVPKVGRLEERQILTYLRISGLPLGYVLNFGAPVMMEGVMRRVNNFPDGTPPYAPAKTDADEDPTL